MKLLIAVPSARQWANFFSASFAALIVHLAERRIEYSVDFVFGSSLLPAARQKSVETAIKGGFTHILMLDDDMTYETKTFDYLVSRKLPFVAAGYVSKIYGAKPLQVWAKDFKGKPASSIGKTGIEKVREVGLGVALLDLSIFANIPRPWFEVPWIDESKLEQVNPDMPVSSVYAHHMGEDYYLCRLMEHHGIPVFIDHDATRGVGHVGDFVFTEAWAVQQAAMKRLYQAAGKLMAREYLWSWIQENLPSIDSHKGQLPPEYDEIRNCITEISNASKWAAERPECLSPSNDTNAPAAGEE